LSSRLSIDGLVIKSDSPHWQQLTVCRFSLRLSELKSFLAPHSSQNMIMFTFFSNARRLSHQRLPPERQRYDFASNQGEAMRMSKK
jgi:hypothetical protein